MVTILIKDADNREVGFFTLDATPSEQHMYESRPTQYPVETGVLISDHIRRIPEKLSIDGFITNSPVIVLTEGDQFTSDNAQLAFDALTLIYEERYLCDVTTRFKSYTDMCLSRLSIPRTNKTGDAIAFSAAFTKIVKVATETVTGPEVSAATSGPAAGTDKQAPTKVKKGKQTPADSIAYDIGEFVGIF